MEGGAACKCEDAGQQTRNTVRITTPGKERHYIGHALGLFQRGGGALFFLARLRFFLKKL
jgi:hypothetical protein